MLYVTEMCVQKKDERTLGTYIRNSARNTTEANGSRVNG